MSLDADTNELADLLVHRQRTAIADLVGPFGGPAPVGHPGDPGPFAIEVTGDGRALSDLVIRAGRYYVDGIACENESAGEIGGVRFTEQPSLVLHPDDAKVPDRSPLLAYLDVWERLVSAAEADAIGDVALGGVDAAGRTVVVWQVRLLALGPGDPQRPKQVRARFGTLAERLQPRRRGLLRARAAPDAGYSGAENRLYRVEVHRGGHGDAATFKWSRDNGSIAVPIEHVDGDVVTLDHPVSDDLRAGDLVEIQYEAIVLGSRPQPPPLLTIVRLDRPRREVRLDGDLGAIGDEVRRTARVLRRWDGAGLVREGDDAWLGLQDGVEVAFAPGGTGPCGYRAGDYWLIPARTATADVRWPRDTTGRPVSRPPRGVTHAFAPLAILPRGDDGVLESVDCRSLFEPRARPA